MSEVAIALVLVAVAIAVSRARRLALERELAIAVVRAIGQLAVIAAAIHVVLENLGWSALLLGVMLAAASWTSGRRLEGIPRATFLAGSVIALSSGAALVVLFAGRAFPFESRYLIPVAGMLIGNCMTATSLAGARLRDEFVDKRAEIEARLALGIGARSALETYVRRAAVNALVPMVDATKNVGLILLPGAFVGMILGGASPAEAAQVQLVVLFMLLGAVSLAAMGTTELVARAFVGPGERVVLPAPLER
ncbi:MAG: ABC transporter permease [Actinomycetota bacterium]